jgi:hypothetical protein
MHRSLVSIKRRNEIVWHRRPLALVRLVADWTRHASPAADSFVPGSPRLIGVVLADPAGVLAAGATHHRPDMGTNGRPRYRVVSPS